MEFASGNKEIDITLSNFGNYAALYLLKLKKNFNAIQSL